MNNKIKLFFTIIIIFSFTNLTQAAEDLWQEVHTKARASNTLSPFSNSREFILDEIQMQRLLGQTKLAFKGGSITPITLPLPNGDTVSISVSESQVLPPQLAEKYPQIKTYQLTGQHNNVLHGRLDFTPAGFHAMLQLYNGETVYIDPLKMATNQLTEKRHYYSYQQSEQHSTTPHQCKLKTAQQAQSSVIQLEKSYQYRTQLSANKTLHNYRIAIATTGEYTHIQGGTVALALSAIATTINRINQVYERDLGVHLTLVNHNDAIIFTNAQSDPFSNGQSHSLILENQRTLDQIIGTNNYDIGHVFGTSGGGLAIIDSVCSTRSKAQGTSGLSNPNSENFYIDFVAHEIAHQFGATHTFNSTIGLCAGSTRTARTAFEPGSGSTIMAYTGICGHDNLQEEADAMFHIGSIEQIQQTIKNNSCGTHSTNINQAPQVNAGNDYIIPAGTPFTLQGTATDPEQDILSYTWQQIDAGGSSPVNYDTGNNALFRAHLATTSSARTFPQLESILTHRKINGETLPVTQRRLQFKFSAQDGKKNTRSDQMSLQVINTGTRFALDLPYSQYTIGEKTTLTWNVAKTNQAPINCTDIDVYLSTNGGKTFTQIADHIINNGSASVYIPNDIEPSEQGRFKIACSDNVFFAISYRNFALSDKASNHQATPLSEPKLIISNNQTLAEPYNREKMSAGSFNPFILFFILLAYWRIKGRTFKE